jgi:hypothetical protein
LRRRENVKPILQALLVADYVYRDAITQKHIIAGVFHSIRLINQAPQPVEVSPEGEMTRVPISPGGHRAGSPFAYMSLTAVRGEQTFVLRYVHLDHDKLVFQTSFKIRSEDPLGSCEAAFPLPDLPTESPGTFALELLWNDEPLGSHKIAIIQTQA